MDAALLIGNGLNRCYDDNISWNNLLENIANEYGVKFNEKNSFPLEFESIINQILRTKSDSNDEIYKKIKGIIAQKIIDKKPKEHSVHEVFVKELGISHILTTNYDYMLEYSFEPNYSADKYPSKTKETKHNIHRRTVVEEKIFYHIHGEANQSDSICLGYEHYIRQLVKMRQCVKDICNHLPDNRRIATELPETWLSLFLTHDIYIVGFGLDFCEIDIWWLLTYRASLYYANINGLKEYIQNKIIIYMMNDIYKYDTGKRELLENLNANCEIVEVKDGDYLRAYKEIARLIKSEMK